jgi:hypothetical protein
MPEYSNIATRMFAFDSFPYRNITITRAHLEKAKHTLRQFRVIGLNEAYNASVHILKSAYSIETLSYEQLIGADIYAENEQTLKKSSHRQRYDKFRAELKVDPDLQVERAASQRVNSRCGRGVVRRTVALSHEPSLRCTRPHARSSRVRSPHTTCESRSPAVEVSTRPTIQPAVASV